MQAVNGSLEAIKRERKSNETRVTRFPPPLRERADSRKKYVNLVGLRFFGLLVNGFVRVRPSRERNRREECFPFFLWFIAWHFSSITLQQKSQLPRRQVSVFSAKKVRGGTSLQVANGMCRWMRSHFHDWIGYNGVTLSIELLEQGRTFSDFLG